MVKCFLCKEKIQELFLGKIKGTIVRKLGSKKQIFICNQCQKKYKSKEELLAKI